MSTLSGETRAAIHQIACNRRAAGLPSWAGEVRIKHLINQKAESKEQLVSKANKIGAAIGIKVTPNKWTSPVMMLFSGIVSTQSSGFSRFKWNLLMKTR